jgi:hypothetical protein
MKRVFVIGLLLTGLLFSCNKDGGKNDDSKLKDEAQSEIVCLELVFPITFIMPDGSEITGDNRQEIGTAMRNWHAANPGFDERGTMQYPVNAIFKGKPVTITNEQEMVRYKKACEEERLPCFTFIYPITYIMPDETAITIASEDDRENKMAIRAWYGENPGVEEKPALQYPVKVKMSKDGTIKTINNEEEMIALKDYCKKNSER